MHGGVKTKVNLATRFEVDPAMLVTDAIIIGVVHAKLGAADRERLGGRPGLQRGRLGRPGIGRAVHAQSDLGPGQAGQALEQAANVCSGRPSLDRPVAFLALPSTLGSTGATGVFRWLPTSSW